MIGAVHPARAIHPARRGYRRLRRPALGALIALAVTALVPGMVAAHPLGNYTINHYAGLRIETDQILLDIVIDQAEIPTFQARLEFDIDGDGEVSDEEIEGGRSSACRGLAPDLDLEVAGRTVALALTDAGLTFPAGVGGLSTMRLVCTFRADLAPAIAGSTTLTFVDQSFRDRLGWREIVATASGVTVAATHGDLRTESLSDRLTAYPTSLLAQAPADGSLALTVSPGGSVLPPPIVPDAAPVAGDGADPSVPDPAAHQSPGPTADPVPVVAVVPGGVNGGDLPGIFQSTDLTPAVLLLALATAGALGAGHALTPGHGKTLMAAYLVGSRGTVLHAVGLGLSVTVSHTIGILVLAALIVGAQDILAPDAVVRGAPVVAAVSIVAIGGWMLASELRRRSARRAASRDAAENDHVWDRPSDAPHDHGAGSHSHGGMSHSHTPSIGSTITWRSLFVLGLAGGLIPSTSALLILLGSVAAGRAGFGFVLVVAFGLGMAVIMGGIGVALVLARGQMDRMPPSSSLGRASGYVPLAAAVLVFGLGLYLTAQALGGPPVL